MRITGAKCDDCHRVRILVGNWAGTWRILKGEGWTGDRGKHRCPQCSKAWRARMHADGKGGGHGRA